MNFRERFARATDGRSPYPYQVRLAGEDWPEVLSVPTGMGKTAAVGLAWIHRRLENDPFTPRRLVFLLPMRVLAEQTVANLRVWLDRLGVLGRPGDGEGRISVSLLMGGEPDVHRPEWAAHPEENAILVGTQDMLLSRALLRGYGISRYQWPVHFALLHTDALWVFDEVQLMGPALATSAQLEAFRRSYALPRPSRSLWLSATIRPEWLGTVDFRPHLAALSVLELGAEDRTRASRILSARKPLRQAPFRLEKETGKEKGAGVKAIAELAFNEHRSGSQTLVIVNRVAQAQAIYRALHSRSPDGTQGPALLLLHARFRPAERREIERSLREDCGAQGRIVVATQAVEAGLDITSTTLISELAPWSSMIQRFGRNNRYGEVEEGGQVIWVDSDTDADPELARPYSVEELAESRSVLGGLDEVGIEHLPDVNVARPTGAVLRKKDFLQLFDTDPDLSGYDIDVSPYIRDRGTPQAQVFWRDFEGKPGREQPAPDRRELCPVSLSQLRDYSGGKVARRVWAWDPVLEDWLPRDGKRNPFLPGGVYLLAAAAGGYDPEGGFDPKHDAPVQPLTPEDGAPQWYGSDHASEGQQGRVETLHDHLRAVRGEAGTLSGRLELPTDHAEALISAALWHDVGKAHPAFQTAIRDAVQDPPPEVILAKSGGRAIPHYRIVDEDGTTLDRRHFRHELASMLAWLSHNRDHPDRDLVAYLIAAHHGKVRMGLRALPREKAAPGGRRYARGVWEGDVLPELRLPSEAPEGTGEAHVGRLVPPTRISLAIMELGRSAAGPSWTERTRKLLADLGPFRLAWLEALLRVADWRASAGIRDGGDPGT